MITQVDGLDFDAAWGRRVEGRYADCDVHFLSREDLVTNKRRVGRPQDLLDADALEQFDPPADDGHE